MGSGELCKRFACMCETGGLFPIMEQPTTSQMAAKRQEIQGLLDTLRDVAVDQDTLMNALSALKIHVRDPSGCESVFERGNLECICTCAGLIPTTTTLNDSHLEALRCVANILLNHPPSRQTVADMGCIETIQSYLFETHSADVAFLMMRILFILTVSNDGLGHELAGKPELCAAFGRVLEHKLTPSQSLPSEFVTCEALKLLYNILLHHGQRIHGDDPSKPFKALLPLLLAYLRKPNAGINLAEHTPNPTVHATHALLSFRINPYRAAWLLSHSKDTTKMDFSAIDAVIDGVDHVLGQRSEDAIKKDHAWMDARLAPLLALLKMLADDTDARQHIQHRLLPLDIDRSEPIHVGPSLTARVIRLLTSVWLPNSKALAGELLYILCDRNPDTLSATIGLGNAAGFLVSRGEFHLPSSTAPSSLTTSTPLNPITGQRVRDINEKALQDMTDEEKEREAERLFVLFQRLNKNGIISVVNPMHPALPSGHIEPLDTTSSSDNESV